MGLESFVIRAFRFIAGKIFINCLIKDIFEEKIRHSPLTCCFPNYSGANNYEEASEFVYLKFQQLNKNSKYIIHKLFLKEVIAFIIKFFYTSQENSVLTGF